MKRCLECNTDQAKRYIRSYCIICYNRLLKNKNITCLDKYPRPQDLTLVQQEYLYGLMLGDGHLEVRGVNPILRIERSCSDLEYLKHNFEVFKDFCRSSIRYREKLSFGKLSKLCNFNTLSCPAFLVHQQLWYRECIKIVPKNLILSPLTCAIWFCDDGCLFNNRKTLGMQLATNSFSKEEVNCLSDKLSEILGGSFCSAETSNKNKNYHIIRTYGKSVSLFIEYVKEYIPPCMSRKMLKLSSYV